MNTNTNKGHIICVPFPAQGHITPMLQFAKLLYTKGFNITFLNTIYNHNRFLKSLGPNSLDGFPGFRFESMHDGLPPSSHDDATQDISDLCRYTNLSCIVPLRDLINRLNNCDGPRVTGIVSDAVMYFTVEVAKEFGIPDVVFWSMSGCGFMGYVHLRTVVDRGLVPLQDASYLTNGYLDTPIVLPGLSRKLRLNDLPSFIKTTDPNEHMLNFIQTCVQVTSQATAIFLNTFELLEEQVLITLSTLPNFPPIYYVGSLDLLVKQLIPGDSEIRTISSSLWKEEPGCIEWLDSQEPNSVVYVNFGSITIMTQEQLIEFAWGLANSKKCFLWVIRPDIVMGGGSSITLPKEFVNETKDRGMLASWCPQKEILKHKSIGGFLTHSGWNSTLESICEGVPMLCWPFFAEQQMNCRYSCAEWGIGMEIKSDVTRKEVEKMVMELMVGSKGSEMRRKVKEWKRKARKAAKPDGSSDRNLNKLIELLYDSKN